MVRRRTPLGPLLLTLTMCGAPVTVGAQPGTATVRIALLSQWVVNQHRTGSGLGGEGRLAPEFQAALDGGVVDRVVFSWQRGVIQRRTLLPKPIRILSGGEAAVLGGSGEFQLVAVRPPAGASAWTEMEVASRTGRSDGVLVLEIGGELNTIGQILETLLVAAPGGPLQELALARRAVVPGDGVPVIGVPFGQPVLLSRPPRFGAAGGGEFLVARSLIDAAVDGDVTTHGPADQSALQTGRGEWREADRVFVRLPLGALRAGAPAIVLAWKDRTYRPDGGPNEQRRARLDVPPGR